VARKPIKTARVRPADFLFIGMSVVLLPASSLIGSSFDLQDSVGFVDQNRFRITEEHRWT